MSRFIDFTGLHRRALAVDNSMPAHTYAANPPPARLIIVGGNEAFVRATVDFLRAYAQIVVVSAHATCEEALAQTRLALTPQIVLVDLDAVGYSGFEAVAQLRKELPRAGIIGLTLASGNGAYYEAALLAGANDVVGKATLPSELPSTLQRLLLKQRLTASPAR